MNLRQLCLSERFPKPTTEGINNVSSWHLLSRSFLLTLGGITRTVRCLQGWSSSNDVLDGTIQGAGSKISWNKMLFVLESLLMDYAVVPTWMVISSKKTPIFCEWTMKRVKKPHLVQPLDREIPVNHYSQYKWIPSDLFSLNNEPFSENLPTRLTAFYHQSPRTDKKQQYKQNFHREE